MRSPSNGVKLASEVLLIVSIVNMPVCACAACRLLPSESDNRDVGRGAGIVRRPGGARLRGAALYDCM